MRTRMSVLGSLSIIIILSLWLKSGDKAPELPNIEAPETPVAPDIGDYTLSHMEYEDLVGMVMDWERKSPLLVETGSHGKTSKGKECFHFRVHNESKVVLHKIMVTASIHGNEPWSTSTVMAYAGWMLSEYGKDERIARILDATEIYFVPVVSPDSYPFSRRVDGVDPNRDFPSIKNPEKKSVAPVQNLRELFLEIKPDSVLSGHTFGRVFLVPWGDTRSNNPNMKDYETIAKEMCRLSGYGWMKASQLYGNPIIGTETDWYHRNGAFAMVMEFGTHQRKPSESDTEKEFEKTKEAFLFFLEESVKVKIK